MSPSVDAGKNNQSSSPKMTEDYDHHQIMSSLSAALSTLDTGHRSIGQNQHVERTGQSNLNYFTSGKRSTGPGSSSSSLSSTVASSSFWGSPPPTSSSVSNSNASIGNYLSSSSNNSAQGQNDGRRGTILSHQIPSENKTVPGHDGRDVMGSVLSQGSSQSLFRHENVNTDKRHNNNMSAGFNGESGSTLSSHPEPEYYHGLRDELGNNTWKQSTSLGSIRSTDNSNTLSSIAPPVSPNTVNKRTSQQLLHVSGKLDAMYTSNHVDNSIGSRLPNTSDNQAKSNLNELQAKWNQPNETVDKIHQYNAQSSNLQVGNGNHQSFQSGSYQMEQNFSMNTGFSNGKNLPQYGNQLQNQYGLGDSVQYPPNGFPSSLPNQQGTQHHNTVQYQQNVQHNSGVLHNQTQKKRNGNGHGFPDQHQQAQAETFSLPPNFNPQQQIFYMAVPMRNGGGQMLQPVQMVNLGNGQSTFVVANHPSVMDANNLNGSVPMTRMENNSMSSSYSQYNGGVYDNNNGMKNNQSSNYGQSHERNSVSSPALGSTNSNSNKKKDKRNKGKSNGGNKQQGHPYGNNGGNSGQYSNPSNKAEATTVNDFQLPKSYSNNTDAQLSTGTNNPTNSSDTITALYHSTHRPPLSSLLGHVRRLSRDQVGCRLLQQSLDEDGPHAATAILNEGLPFLTEAMTDPFGNYLFQKILEKITAEERLLLVTTVGPRLVNAALNLHGTRSVQKVVEMSALDDASLKFHPEQQSVAEIVTSALAPAAARLCIDSHGNHVIQRILQKLPHKHSKFVFEAVAQSVGDVARHRHGCCVIQRCLDSPPSPARSNLVKRIVEKSLDLMQDAYGNYVVQYVLDVCGDEEAGAVCESVVGKIGLLAIQKFSSNVMEKCLERSNDRVRELHLNELSSPDKIRELMIDPFGNYVVQKALSVATHTQAIRLVEAMRPHLPGMRNTAGGRRIVAKISRRFPRFDPNVGITTSNPGLENGTSTNKPVNVIVDHHHHQQQQQAFQMHHPHHVNYPHPIYINAPNNNSGLPPGMNGGSSLSAGEDNEHLNHNQNHHPGNRGGN